MKICPECANLTKDMNMNNLDILVVYFKHKFNEKNLQIGTLDALVLYCMKAHQYENQ